jgi:AcrR family transcriptional regulator
MKENPMSVRSKDSIEEALLSLMQEQPYKSITIRSLTERAGLSRQTFYLNFADKEAILTRHMSKMLEEIMLRVHTEHVDTIEKLTDFYTAIVEENAPFFRLIVDNGLADLVKRVFRDKLTQLPPVLESQRENRSETERRYFNGFWVAAFIEVYTIWLLENQATDRGEIVTMLSDIMRGNYFYSADHNKTGG